MEHATSDCLSVPEAEQGATENDDGTETEAVERGRAKEVDAVVGGKAKPRFINSRKVLTSL